MTDLLFYVAWQLAKGLAKSIGNKDRIIAKTARSARLESQLPVTNTFGFKNDLTLGFGYRERTNEPGATVVAANAFQLIEKHRDLVGKARGIAAVSRRVNARPPIERRNL